MACTGPLTVPLSTRWPTLISPSTMPFSLTTSMLGLPGAAVTLPRTRPSRRRPPANTRSPSTAVSSPIRVSIERPFFFENSITLTPLSFVPNPPAVAHSRRQAALADGDRA
ncbi:hypothetical protein D3C72_1738580 [compost metagenome]